MERILVLLPYICCSFLLNSAEVKSDQDLEQYFKLSECIEEPNEDFLTKYLLTNGIQSETSSTNTKEAVRNFRSEVNLLVHYNNIDFSYNIENEDGPTHKKVFNISLILGDEIYYGVGKSKKEAKEMAAKQAILNTTYKKPTKLKDKNEIDENSPPTVVLNNIGFKHGYQIQYYMVDPMLSKRIINLNKIKNKSLFSNSSFWKQSANLDAPPKSPFNIEVDLDGKSFYGKAHTIQAAKHEAATKAIEFLDQKGLDKISVCTEKGSEVECAQAKANLKSPISLLYEYGNARRLPIEFKEIDKTGPSHKPVFEVYCSLGPESITAKGRSKKEAKRKCAEEMIQKIPDLDLPVNLNDDESTSVNSKLKKRTNKDYQSVLVQSEGIMSNIQNLFKAGEPTENEEESSKKGKSKKSKKSGNEWSPKEKLSKFGQDLNLNIEFQTIPRQKSGFYSILNLKLNPTYICLGVGSNREISQEYAALNALKFLHNIDLLEGVTEDDLAIERFSFDNYIYLAKHYTEKQL